jgi:hypothetical protein
MTICFCSAEVQNKPLLIPSKQGGGEGGGGGGEGGDGGGDSGVPVQISKPVPVTEPSLYQVTVDPAATRTFIGPVEPE